MTRPDSTKKQNSSLSSEEVVECDSSEESDGGSDYWTDRVSGEDVRNRSRDQLLHQHQQQHDLFKALSESGKCQSFAVYFAECYTSCFDRFPMITIEFGPPIWQA